MVLRKNAKLTEEHADKAIKRALGLLLGMDMEPKKYAEGVDFRLFYHGFRHTSDHVLPAFEAIAEKENLDEEEVILGKHAAGFHDTGFLFQYLANESIGASLAEGYMLTWPLPYTRGHIEIVRDAIQNTDMKNPPQTKVAAVLRDADLSSLGHPDFLSTSEALKIESRLHPESPMHEASLDDQVWATSQLKFISGFHDWFTDGARQLYQEQKEKNIAELREYHGL